MIFLDDPGPVQHVGPTIWINCSSSLRNSDRSGLAVERMDFFIGVWIILNPNPRLFKQVIDISTVVGTLFQVSGLKNASFELWVYLKFIS